MSVGIRRPWDAVDYREIVRLLPPPPEYFETGWLADPETISRVQLGRLRQRAESAGRVPFFARRWADAGFEPGDLCSLDDLWKVPAYTVDDIRRSIEEHPPWGDYQGVTPDQAHREPMRLFMSGGTTGEPRPTLFTEWDREAGSVLLARHMYLQGLRPGDVVLNSWSYGTHSGAFAFDDALRRWLNCVVVPTSTGSVTSTRKQVEIAIRYRAAAVLAHGDFLLHLAEVAREMGYDPRRDFRFTTLSTIGDGPLLEETFGLPCYATYGFHEVATVAVECPAREGLHIFEDAFVVQVVDVETGEPVPDGQLGSMCVTELYKTGSPQFRYNIMDLSSLYPPGQCACGSWLRRMAPFAGRADTMVKLRGINVWPEAVGRLASAVPGVAPDYFVRAVRDQHRDDLLVSVVSPSDPSAFPAIAQAVEARLHDELGVRVVVDVVRPGELDKWTEVHSSPKAKRFRDERGS